MSGVSGGVCCCAESRDPTSNNIVARVSAFATLYVFFITLTIHNRPSSKTQSQRELHLTRRPCTDSLTKRRTGLLPRRRVEDRGRIDRVQLRVVEDVVQLPAEREYALFIPEIEIPEQRHIKVASSGSTHGVFRSISDVASSGEGDARRIEKPVNSLFGVTEIRITHEIHSLSVRPAAASQKIRACRREDIDSQRCSTRERRHAGNLPVVCERSEFMGFQRRDIVLPVGDQDMRLV